jgi:hypothetical protein
LQAQLLQRTDTIGVTVEKVVTGQSGLTSLMLDPDGPTHRVEPRDDSYYYGIAIVFKMASNGLPMIQLQFTEAKIDPAVKPRDDINH